MSSTQLNDLHPALLPLALAFEFDCRNAGLDILTTCTYRSETEQDELYAIGRTVPGKIVTNAQGGQSDHNFTIDGAPAAKAFDIVPLREGRAIWDTSAPEWQKIAELWEKGYGPNGLIVNGAYLDWYGKPDAPFREYAHFCLKEVNS